MSVPWQSIASSSSLSVSSFPSPSLSTDLATVVGYFAVSRPFLDLSNPRHLNTSHSERMMVSVSVSLTTCLFCLHCVFLLFSSSSSSSSPSSSSSSPSSSSSSSSSSPSSSSSSPSSSSSSSSSSSFSSSSSSFSSSSSSSSSRTTTAVVVCWCEWLRPLADWSWQGGS